ncbi:hypothetical protein, partial [Falsigemmobacter intermedius]|uniref:hypothetical protein n=1 Tax=Falsigemmobacter intermedius TaxID=1553448 RepID=UPI001F4FEA83
MRFSGLAEAVCEGFQARVMMCRDQGCLEHHVSQSTATSSDGPFPAKCSTVVRDRGQTVSAAACPPVMVPISGISAISIVRATGPIPGIERRTPAVSDRRSSLAMARVIRFSKFLDQTVDPLLQLGVDVLEHH